MKSFNRLVILFLLLVLSSGMAMAQCPQGKTAVIWMNGIWVTNPIQWAVDVVSYEVQFLNTHPSINPTCIMFVPVYNTSHGWYDLAEATPLITLQNQLTKYAQNSLSPTEYVDLVRNFVADNGRGISSSDPDLLTVYDAITTWWSAGYQQVILVGHSEGALFTNEAYTIKYLEDRIITSPKLPNPNILSVVGIATPAHTVADGRNKYTTQCNDIIEYVRLLKYLPLTGHSLDGSNDPLNWNISDNSGSACIGPETIVGGTGVLTALSTLVLPPWDLYLWGLLLQTDKVAVTHDTNVHDLKNSYMVSGSPTQKMIFDDLIDTLPDPGCGADVNCYLKDSFGSNVLTNNWQQYVPQGSTAQENSGTLRLSSYSATGSGYLAIWSRRIFTGPFTASFLYNSNGTGNTNIRLVNPVSYAVAAYGTILPGAVNSSWHSLTFTKTDTQINLFVDGTLYQGFPSNPTDGYYLYFNLQGNNNLQIQNLSVVRGAITPLPPAMILTPAATAVSVVQGGASTVKLTLSSQGGMTGKPILALNCSASCPAGFNNSYTSGSTQTLPPNGTIPISVTFNALSSAALGTSNFVYSAVLNGVTKTANIAVTVTTPPNMTLAPAANTLPLVQGSSGYVDLTVANPNGTTVPFNITLSCTACPAGMTYSFPFSGSVPANGSVPIRMNFTAVSTPLGIYSFDVHVGLAVANITLVVLAPATPLSVSCTFDHSPAVVQEANLVTASQTGGIAPVTFTLNGYNGGNTLYVIPSNVGTASVTVKGTDAIGRISTGSCSVPVIATPQPVLKSLSVNTAPKVGLPISVTLLGSGFIHGSYGYYCNSPLASATCLIAVTTSYVNGGQLNLSGVQWSSPATLYLKVVNPGGLSSGFVTMVVIP